MIIIRSLLKHFTFLSNVISRNSHKPRVLFNIFNSVVNPCNTISIEDSSALCDNLLEHHVDQISILQRPHSHNVLARSSLLKCSAVFQQFESAAFSSLREVVYDLRPSNSPHDIHPPCLFKETLHVIGPSIGYLLHASLTSGYVPAAVQTHCCTAYFKKEKP